MKQVFSFWHHGHLLTQVIAETEAEAREKADKEADILCDRPLESPYARRLHLKHSQIRTYPVH